MSKEETIKALIDPESQRFLESNIEQKPDRLLFKKHSPSLPIKELVHQINCRQKFKNKLPSWYKNTKFIFPKKVSVEQCSSEETANYKAAIISKGDHLIDLTGGMGIDFIALSKKFNRSIYLEENDKLVSLAEHNFAIGQLKNYTLLNGKAEEYIRTMNTVDLIYIDPHRRDDNNKKMISLEDCQPNILNILPSLLQKTTRLLIKSSPMLGLKETIKSLHSLKEVHIVSFKNECKELLFLIEKGWEKETKLICGNITSEKTESFSFYLSEEDNLSHTIKKANKYIYIPNTSVTKAGAFKSISDRFRLDKLHKNSHVYTSDTFIRNFPGRSFILEENILYSKAKARLKELAISKAIIIIRNFKEDIHSIKKKIGIKKEGNPIILATTNHENQLVLLLLKEITS